MCKSDWTNEKYKRYQGVHTKEVYEKVYKEMPVLDSCLFCDITAIVSIDWSLYWIPKDVLFIYEHIICQLTLKICMTNSSI